LAKSKSSKFTRVLMSRRVTVTKGMMTRFSPREVLMVIGFILLMCWPVVFAVVLSLVALVFLPKPISWVVVIVLFLETILLPYPPGLVNENHGIRERAKVTF
jgi:hypothetical protein